MSLHTKNRDRRSPEDKKHRNTFRPLVYICSPYSGDTVANAQKARAFCRFAVDQGCIPLAPHLFLPQFMNEETERELAMFMDLVFMGKCSEVWVLSEYISEGMAYEIYKATRRKQPIRYFNSRFEEIMA